MDEYFTEADMEQDESRRRRLFVLADNILQKRAEAIEHRANSGVERRWREDAAMFASGENNSPSMLDYATGDAYRKGEDARRSQVEVNIIRGRCETAEGRFSDIQLPTDDRNWGLKVTPVPELSEQMEDERPAMQAGTPIVDDQGQQATMSDIARDRQERAKKAMKLMEMELDDQLNECDYNGECRKLIRKAIRLGTGVIKGPNVVKSVRHAWTPEVSEETGTVAYMCDPQEDMQPASQWVDPWNVYPSPGTKENVQKTAEYIFEKDEILPRDVRSLMEVEGYFEDQLKLVLTEEPKRTRAAYNEKKETHTAEIDTIRKGQSYEKWEYHGDVSRDDLESMGLDCAHTQAQSLTACVVFINDRAVKVELNPLDTGHLPYDFFQWTSIDTDSPWGIGIPRMMQWLQRIITGAWRSMMDNAGNSSGANVIIGKGVQPADSEWNFGGYRFWFADGDIDDARKAFAQFQLSNNQAELQNIIELALRFVDLETSLPTIFQAEAQTAPETLGATNIMVDSSNIGVRQRVKLFDDRITRPHITRYYHYNMQYSDKPEIKGDFNVDARGVSELLEKDQQAMALANVFAMKGDPDVALITDWEKATRQLYANHKLKILKDDDEIARLKKQQQEIQEPPNPQVQTAQIRTEGEMAKEELRQQSDMAELQFKAEQAELERHHDKQMKEYDLQMMMMEYAEKRGIELDKLKTQLALGSAGMNLQRELSEKSAEEKTATPEVSEPPTEPAQHAPDGQAYQQ